MSSSAAPLPTSARRSLLSRSREGRWLGGVCAGLAPPRALKVGWVRLGFLLASLLGGLGLVAYAACWLILPLDGADPSAPGARGGLVVLVQGVAACAGLAILALAAAAATIFGFGWLVLLVGGAGLAAALLIWSRTGPAWALLPLAALSLPAAGVAAAGLRLSPQTGASVIAPTTLASAHYTSGLGTLLIDLRRSRIPASGTVTLRIDAGVRRTIIALPHAVCLPLRISYSEDPYLARIAAAISGWTLRPFSELVAFGRVYDSTTATVQTPAAFTGGATLDIRFHSMGGSLYVRDYPTTVDPSLEPDWPGYPVVPELRPDTAGMTRRGARAVIAAWRRRVVAERAAQASYERTVPGPCGGTG